MGGRTTGNSLSNTVEILNVETNKFIQGPSLPKSVEKFSSVVSYAENYRGIVYILGGKSGNGQELSSIHKISAEMLSNQQWVKIGDMSKTRSSFNTFLLGDNFFPRC